MSTLTPRRRASSPQTAALWARYDASRDPAIRDRLVLSLSPLVKYIVYRKAREMPARCEIEDFLSVGLEALIQSIDRYDPSKGATLEQYAWTRIHGAVLDELRRGDWAPRSVRRWERDIDKAAAEFATLHGRRPTTEEHADALGIRADELRRRRHDLLVADVASLNAPVAGDDELGIERVDTLANEDARSDPLFAAATTEAKEKFRAAFAALPQREREVAVMLYVNNLTLAEIGKVLGVSESRVCQIHGQMKRTLRSMLSSDAELFAHVA
ncbi:MAG TPA: FliA/WhiG family RNA polymerase sigma factor [Solirubrobacteraceae bacterium]|nr:FliA/WhiG family RNA polymerase sigma factor [Solirubrobacteraceae bacterium]